MIKIITTMLFAFYLVGCLPFNEKVKKSKNGFSNRNIKYYADKTTTSLEVPPDLTKPNLQNALKLSNYITNTQEDVISFSKDDAIVNKKVASVVNGFAKVKVRRFGQIRWIVVDKKIDVVWNLAEKFFKSYGFVIKRSDREIGIMETNFLENHSETPDQSVGFIRAILQKTINTKYTLPIIDKYRIRIEPADSGNGAEVYFTLNSMEEVVTKAGSENENTIWQVRSKDQLLETEMLYRFMVYLGSDNAIARDKITAAKEKQIINAEIMTGLGGYAKLKFSLGMYETWKSIDWALDELNIDIEDKDVKEGSFYVNSTNENNNSIFSDIFGDNAIQKSYQIIVKQIDANITEVYLNDLDESNTQEDIEFSHKFLSNIAKQFQ